MKKKLIRRETINLLSNISNIHPVLQRVYSARGIKDPVDLEHDLKHLLPFDTLSGIEQAAKCIVDAISNQKNILIIGDFDADGATSTALAVSALESFGAKHVDFLVPNRFQYGYGLTPEIVDVAQQKQPQLIITVDNGISSHSGVARANTLGIQVVITDHHLPGKDLPDAAAIVNPQKAGDIFQSKHIAGVGVIFYVMLAVRNELRQQTWFERNNLLEPNMAQFLDLVALGTVADLVSLDKNNRILVQQGIKRIRGGKSRPGIKALLTLAGKTPEKILAGDLGFSVGPRLNAAGRLSDMTLGIKCLLSHDLSKARELATQLSLLNEERKLIEFEMKQQAFAELNKIKHEMVDLSSGICLFDENWHQGVIGLLASRVKDHFHRPVIVFAPGNNADELKGSARSIQGLHIRDLLDSIAARFPELIHKFGGHAMAAGLSISRSAYQDFSRVFKAEVKKLLELEQLEGGLYTDGALEQSDFSLDLAKQIREFTPWGQSFPEPIFEGRFKILNQRLVGTKHLKLTLVPDNSAMQIEAIAFNIDVDSWPNFKTSQLYAAYRLSINDYQGRESLQLILDHLEEA